MHVKARSKVAGTTRESARSWPPYLDSGRSRSGQALQATVCSQGSQDCDDQRDQKTRSLERRQQRLRALQVSSSIIKIPFNVTPGLREASDNHRDQVETYGRDASDVNSLKRISLTRFCESLVDN